LQASKLSCSCQEATVSFPPGLGELGPLVLLGEHATSNVMAHTAVPSSLICRGLLVIMRPAAF
jgi:hypothetical protein